MKNIKEVIRTIIKEESEYQQFFRKALEKAGKSIPAMSDEEKKAFFNKIDAAWDGKSEKNEGNAFGAAVTKAKEEGDDEFTVDGKTYPVKESVNEAKVIVHNEKTGERFEVLSGKGKGDLLIAMNALQKSAPSHMKYSIKESVNEYDEWKNTRTQSKNIFRMLKQKYNNNISKMRDGLELILKQNNTQKDQAEVMRDEFNKFFKIKTETVNENKSDGWRTLFRAERFFSDKFDPSPRYLPFTKLHKIFKGKFDSKKFREVLKNEYEKIGDSSFINTRQKNYIRDFADELRLNASKYLGGNVIENVKFYDDVTEEAAKLYKVYVWSLKNPAEAKALYENEVNSRGLFNPFKNESINENFSNDDITKIKGAVESASSFMGIGSELKKLGMKYDFSTSPLPVYMIKKGSKTFVLVNKKYAEKPDFVVGTTAGGLLEGTVNETQFKIGDKIIISHPIITKPIKGIVSSLITAKGEQVLILKGGQGVWDAKFAKLDEGNAFGAAVTAAKKEGKKEFEFNGKIYKVKKGSYEKNEAAKKLAEKKK